MSDFPYCEICGEAIKYEDYAVELYSGVARDKGLLRNMFGILLYGSTTSLGTAHASCLHPGHEDTWNEGELARKTLLDAAGKTLVDKDEVEA